jgi:hypothetical protein
VGFFVARRQFSRPPDRQLVGPSLRFTASRQRRMECVMPILVNFSGRLTFGVLIDGPIGR